METVLAEMLSNGSIAMDALPFDNGRWYEIDTVEDLQEAELMFPLEVAGKKNRSVVDCVRTDDHV